MPVPGDSSGLSLDHIAQHEITHHTPLLTVVWSPIVHVGRWLRASVLHLWQCLHVGSHAMLDMHRQAAYLPHISPWAYDAGIPHIGNASPHVRFFVCRKFRVVPAALYLEFFASDRTHMLAGGSQPTYHKPPPQYACIVSQRELPPPAHTCEPFREPE